MTATQKAQTARRKALAADFTAEQISEVTRGLTIGRYAQAFRAGENSIHIAFDEDDLDDRINRYIGYGDKKPAHEHAFLEGNTWAGEAPEDHLRYRLEHP